MILPNGRMRWIAPILLALVLTACNMPSPQFRGVAATRITVDGSTFDVRVRENAAEAMRINAQYAPRFGPIKERASKAMALVSGCEVKSVSGDQALAFGRLKCGKSGVVYQEPTRQEVSLECIPQRGTELKGINQVSVELDCY